MHDDATQPRRADVLPPDFDPHRYEALPQNDGPGCFAWGIMGLFAVAIAVAIVVSAIFAGFNQGLNTARVTAAAATSQNISRQCNILPTDIAANRFDLVRDRFEVLTVDGVLVPCATVFVPQATIAYQQSQATATLPATPTPSPTTASIVDTGHTPTATSAVSANGYDLDALFAEGQQFIADGDYQEAISTFSAILAIDESYRSQEVNGLLFNALVNQARFLYQTGSLSEAIIVTNRAAEYGDISNMDLSFERSVANLYLDAQANLNVNYGLAIQYLNQVINLSANYPNSTGRASEQLVEQYRAYADALLIGGDPCAAEIQFNNALALRPNNPQIQTAAQTANQQCQLGVVSTPDPNASPNPNASPTSGIAPVGQTGN